MPVFIDGSRGTCTNRHAAGKVENIAKLNKMDTRLWNVTVTKYLLSD